MIEVRDYNGTGRWSKEAIQACYLEYCRVQGMPSLTDLAPTEHSEGEVRWIYPLMEKVIDGIEAGDPACVALGVDFIEEDARFAFGRLLKSDAARALRRARLTLLQVARIRQRMVSMLLAGNVPHEFKQYARLLRRVGVGDRWLELENGVNRANPYVMRWFNYLRKHPLIPA